MLVNLNEEILEYNDVNFTSDNRAFKYGDGVFESIKYSNGQLNFSEDHYFRLMASMRIIRMEIPMHFTQEYIEEQILETIQANHQDHQTCAVRITVYRSSGGKYTPTQNSVEWLIETNTIADQNYVINNKGLKLDVFKDHYKPIGLLSNIKTTNCLIYTVAGIYAQENALDDVVLVNHNKYVVEATSSNFFMIKDNVLTTPPIESGCLKGIIRKKIILMAPALGLVVEERNFSPFEIQRADEVFLTNAIAGVKWVEQFKKKTFVNHKTTEILKALNALIH